MFFSLSFLLCAIEVLAPHMTSWDSHTHFQIALAVIALLSIAQRGRKKERAVLTVFAIWYVWMAATDWAINYLPPVLASYEGTVFAFLAAWAWFRPYRYVSDRWTRDTVSIAFYGGDRAPILSGLGMLVGLPFSAVALCVGSEALKADRRSGLMTIVGTNELVRTRQYSFVNTGIPVTQEIKDAMAKIRGETTTIFGPIRGRCLANMRPVLKLLGDAWYPRGWRLMPSAFYGQCVRARK